jgi:hypothetical protein
MSTTPVTSNNWKRKGFKKNTGFLEEVGSYHVHQQLMIWKQKRRALMLPRTGMTRPGPCTWEQICS